MNVLLACPGLEDPKCGIGNYTKQFARALQLLGVNTVCYGGPLLGLYDRVLETNCENVHVQFEYGWASWERLWILGTQLMQMGKRLVLTYHTVGPALPHNYYPVVDRFTTHIVVHNKEQHACFPHWAFQGGRIHHIPLAVANVVPATDSIITPRIRGVARFGWFGNVFFHKGLDRLLRETADFAFELLILGGRSPHSVEYYETCRELAKRLPPGRCLWYNDYLPDSHVVAHLSSCDAILFPYCEYGATGCSAALRLAFNAERPCYVSFCSHFGDVLVGPQKSRPVGSFTSIQDLGQQINEYRRQLVKAANKLRAQWSFPAIVSRHIQEVYV